MPSELSGGFDYGALKTAAMVVFFGIFVAIVLWLALSKSRVFQEMSRLPLEEDPPRQKRD